MMQDDLALAQQYMQDLEARRDDMEVLLEWVPQPMTPASGMVIFASQKALQKTGLRLQDID
jgi:3-oxoacyl-[acyl-carrier-protein] synthase III